MRAASGAESHSELNDSDARSTPSCFTAVGGFPVSALGALVTAEVGAAQNIRENLT